MQISRFQRILVCWNGARKDMLPLVGRIAVMDGATVRLMACLPDPPAYRSMAVPNYSELADLAREALEEQLNGAVRRLSARGVTADWVISKCFADNALLRELEAQTYDLVMVAAQKQGTRYTAYSSTVQLMRQASCPVWVVRPGHLRTTARVLAAVAADGPQELNMRLLFTASTLATKLQRELHVLSVWNACGESMLRGHPLVPIHAEDVRRYHEDIRAQCAGSLRRLVGHSGLAIDHRRMHIIKGHPRRVIPQFCHENGIAVLVMGTVARTGLIGALLGNTAEKIAKALPATLVSVGPLSAGTGAAEHLERNATPQARAL